MAEFEYRHRFAGLHLRKRCQLPEAWEGVPAGRRFAVFGEMVKGRPGEAVRLACQVPARHWHRIGPMDRAAILRRCPWAKLDPAPKCHFDVFRHNGLELHAPPGNFAAGTCLEYPIADEYLSAYIGTQADEQLLLLTATLFREADPDQGAALRREDKRVPLFSRAEVEERAKRLEGLPLEYQLDALMYFTGVKKFVATAFASLFQSSGKEKEADPLGWFGLYMDKAQGDPKKYGQILHSNFIEFCLMEVRQRRQAREAYMRQRMQSGEFAND